MKTEILMPSLSPTMEEGNLAKWYVSPGDKVKPGDIIADIETDKALMEYECIEEGTIVELVVEEGTENIKVNSLIAVIETDGAEETRNENNVATMKDEIADIKKNDVLTGVYKPEEGITLHHNETVVTTFNDKDFARSFFLIWLHENTSEPKLRQGLLEFREDG